MWKSNITLAKWQVNFNNNNSCWEYVLLCDVMKMVPYIFDLPPKMYNTSLILRKASDSSQFGTSYKIPNQHFSKLSKSSKIRSLRNSHSQEESKVTWGLSSITWCPCKILEQDTCKKTYTYTAPYFKVFSTKLQIWFLSTIVYWACRWGNFDFR